MDKEDKKTSIKLFEDYKVRIQAYIDLVQKDGKEENSGEY